MKNTVPPRSIFITGGASGIGLATARLFAAHGWFIGAYDINSAALGVLERELGSNQGIFETLDAAFQSS